MAKGSQEQSDTPKKGRGNLIFKIVLIAALAVGGYYGGLTVFRMRNTHTFTGLTMYQDDGLLIYKYKPPGDTGPQTEDWVLVSLGSEVEVYDADGTLCSLHDVYPKSSSKAVVEVTIDPDGTVGKIRVEPSGFCVEGEVEQKESDQITIDKNSYTLQEGVRFPGKEGDVVRIYGLDDVIMFAELIEKAGFLQVSSNVEGARIFVDGSFKGKAPLTVAAAPGLREVSAKADEHKMTKMTVQVEPEEETQVFIEMPRVVGTLEVTSNPSKAQIYLDEDLIGVTPLKIQVAPGNYEVVAESDGYYPKRVAVRVREDGTESIHFDLVKEKTGSFPTLGTLPGITPPGETTAPKDTSTVKVKILGFNSSDRTLNCVDSLGNLRNFQIPADIPLQGASGGAPWANLLPGEEIELTLSSAGDVIRAVKVYSHVFSDKGTVVSKEDHAITLGEKWSTYQLTPDVLVERPGEKGLSGNIDIGDTVTVYGASHDDIRYVYVERSSSYAASFECYLVHSENGTIFYGENSVLSLKMKDAIDVIDHAGRRKDKVSQVPSGSKVRLYVNNAGEVVSAEYVWKADVSLEGRVASFVGPVVTVIPSWEDLMISHDTVVFQGSNRRPFYDLEVGDTVMVAGPSDSEIGFILIQDRMTFESAAEGFIGSSSGSKGRVFYKIEGHKDLIPQMISPDLNFIYLKERIIVPCKDMKWGDKVKLWLDGRDNPVWCEILEKNELSLYGHYLGEKGDLHYFSGFIGLQPSEDITVVGVSKFDEIGVGSTVYIGGQGNIMNYVEIDNLCEPLWWIHGDILNLDKASITILSTRYGVINYLFAGDVGYVDWAAKKDGKVAELEPGDDVKIGIDVEKRAVFVEKTGSPRFRIDGTITAISNRTITVTGDYGTLQVVVNKNAAVYKGGEIQTYSALAKGDKVMVSGYSADSIDLVVCGK